LNLQRPQHGAERRQPELALPQWRVSRYLERAVVLAAPIAHRHREGALLTPHRALHLCEHRAGARRGAGGRLEPQRAQHDLGIVLRIEQRLAQHVAPGALLGALGNVGRKVRARLLGAQRRLIDRERGHGDVHLEAALQDLGGNKDRATQVM